MNKNFVKYIPIRYVEISSIKVSLYFISLLTNQRKQK